MGKEVWYWEYILKIWNEIDNQMEYRSGVVAATSFSEAADLIEQYYGDEIMDVESLQPICDTVFDFDEIMEDEDSNFDFQISRKGAE